MWAQTQWKWRAPPNSLEDYWIEKEGGSLAARTQTALPLPHLWWQTDLCDEPGQVKAQQVKMFAAKPDSLSSVLKNDWVCSGRGPQGAQPHLPQHTK